jgi:hypothetical protein
MRPHMTPLHALAALALVASACSISRPGVGETTTIPPLSSPVSDVLTLHAEGIGPFLVGDDAASVVDGLAAVIGGWDLDSADGDSDVQLPECLGATPRIVSWGSLALVFVQRGDRDILASWSYGFDPLTGNSQDLRRLGLETARGIGLGATRTELTTAYRVDISITDIPSIDSAVFEIDANETPHLSGKLDAAGPEGVVDLLQIEPTC